MIRKIDEGSIPKNTAKRIWAEIKDMDAPLDIVRVLQKKWLKLLKDTYAQSKGSSDYKKRLYYLNTFNKYETR